MSALDAEYAPVWDAEAAGPVEVGIDAIEIERIAGVLERHGSRFLQRVYTERERERYGKRIPELAARFAAKEATMKALGTGWGRNVGWTEIEVYRPSGGRPEIRLHGKTAAFATSLGIRRFALALTHTAETALAEVIAES